MTKSGSSQILSAITGAVLLIHVLGLVALMVQRSSPVLLERPAKMAVRIQDASELKITAVHEQQAAGPPAVKEPMPAAAPAVRESASIAQQTQSDPPESAASLTPPAPAEVMVAASLPAKMKAPTKKTDPSKTAQLLPAPKKAARTHSVPAQAPVAKPATLAKAASKPSDKLRSSSAAQAALKRLRQPVASESGSAQRAADPEVQRAGPDMQSRRSQPSQERALDALIAALQNCVQIPEQGEVRMRIQINSQGRVTQMQCLKAASARNRDVIEKSLRLIRLPVEGLTHDGSLSVVVTFKHA